jgi:hypothetical protein
MPPKEEPKVMLFPKCIQWSIKLWTVVMTAAALIFAGVEMLLAARPETKAPSPGMATATPASLSPIPVPVFGDVGVATIADSQKSFGDQAWPAAWRTLPL